VDRAVRRCSFCSKAQGEVRLVAGPSDVYICNLCVALCNEILAQDTPPDLPQRTQAPEPPGQRSGRGPLIVTEITSG
jgi:ATP-dependent protease Clp ATPase subunit